MQGHQPLGQNDNEFELDDLEFVTSVDPGAPQNASMQPPQQQQPQYNNNSSAINKGGVEYGATSEITNDGTFLGKSSHPISCIFHCLFKASALSLYCFNGVFFDNKSGANFVSITVCCIILLAMDFWVVKNITGRLLVGLRWWNKLSGDGQSTEWIFESSTDKTQQNPYDAAVFWTVLYTTPLVWVWLLLVGVFKLEIGWLITVVGGLAMSGSNVYGYWKCSSDQKAKFNSMMARGAEMGVMSMMRNNFFGMLGRGGGAAPQTVPNTAGSFS